MDEENKDSGELNFHYQRGSFRQHEQQSVRDMATGAAAPKKGLFRVLVSTKGNRMVFFVMVICFVLVALLGFFMDNPDESSFCGVHVSLNSFCFDETVYTSLEFIPEKNYEIKDFSAAFDFHIQTSDSLESSAYKCEDKIIPSPSEKSYIRVSCTDYDYVKVICTVCCGDEKKVLVKKIIRN